MSESAEIVFSRQGGAGRILLNRPQALNSLTMGMCEALLPQLRAWKTDPAIKAVVITGAGEKAFCAGGDVVRMYEDRKAGGDLSRTFWRQEYRCNAQIKHFGKPYVALLDGIVMGGGVGVSVHGSHRIVTERTLFAMPETGLGLFPDVGGSYFLPRLPGAAGMFLGLTGRRLKAADCVALGIAQAFVPHERCTALEAALAESDGSFEAVTQLVNSFAVRAGDAPLAPHRGAIDRHFSLNSVAAILTSLEADGSEWAVAQLNALRKYSPLALKLTFQQLRRGAVQSFDDCMRMEWRIANRVAVGYEFFEGVRALLVDKDNAPRWSHAAVAAVSDSEVDAYFAPLPGDELDLSDIAV